MLQRQPLPLGFFRDDFQNGVILRTWGRGWQRDSLGSGHYLISWIA